MNNHHLVKAVIMGMLMVIFVSAVPAAQATTRLSIATSGTGGTWYLLGGTMASIIGRYIPDTEATAYPSAASIENIRALRKGQTDIVMLMPDIAYWAYTGTEQFAKDKPYKELRAIFAMHPIPNQIVVLESSGIHSIRDMKGKKISVGAPGSGSEIMTRLMLAEYGLTYKDLSVKFLHYGEGVEAMKDGNIDGLFATIGVPAPVIMDLLTVRKCRFIDIEPDMLQRLTKKYPFYVPFVIKAGTYKGQPTPNTALAWMGIVAVDAKMKDQLVYDIVKAFWDHKDEVDKVHVQFKDITLHNATRVPIPLHPGAMRFYKERGIIK